MSNTALKNVFQDFAEVAAPYLRITDEAHYEETLALIEALMEDAQDSEDDPLNSVITLVAQAIAKYERQIETLAVFEQQCQRQCKTDPPLQLKIDPPFINLGTQNKLGDRDDQEGRVYGDQDIASPEGRYPGDRPSNGCFPQYGA